MKGAVETEIATLLVSISVQQPFHSDYVIDSRLGGCDQAHGSLESNYREHTELKTN